MQIAVRYDKVHPPRRIDVAEAAARAVVALLAAPASAPGGVWSPAVEYWRDGRIRKIVRRARGKRWEEVQRIDGVTITQDGPSASSTPASPSSTAPPRRPAPTGERAGPQRRARAGSGTPRNTHSRMNT